MTSGFLWFNLGVKEKRMAKKITVELCMGSSCFARGNSGVLQAIESYLTENDLLDSVDLVGHLCLGKCNQGPNMRIDGVDYSGLSTDEALEYVIKALEE